MTQMCTWKGQSGTVYEFKVHELSQNWQNQSKLFAENGLSAIYIFSRLEANKYLAIYIGQASDLNKRLTKNHHKINCILQQKVTHIHIYGEQNEVSRRIIEQDLIDRYQFLCND